MYDTLTVFNSSTVFVSCDKFCFRLLAYLTTLNAIKVVRRCDFETVKEKSQLDKS